MYPMRTSGKATVVIRYRKIIQEEDIINDEGKVGHPQDSVPN